MQPTPALARLLLILTSVSLVAQVQLPKTPVREVTDEYFGSKVIDPYRWLEKTDDPEVAAWIKAQNDYTRNMLTRIPGRDQLLERVKALDNAGAVVSALQVWGGKYFYYKTEPGSDNRKLYVRDGLRSPERLLVDPEKLTTPDGKHYSIDYFQPSIDGAHVAYGISQGGSENSVLHVLASATGKVLSAASTALSSGLPAGCPRAIPSSIRGCKSCRPMPLQPRDIRNCGCITTRWELMWKANPPSSATT